MKAIIIAWLGSRYDAEKQFGPLNPDYVQENEVDELVEILKRYVVDAVDPYDSWIAKKLKEEL